ncbi:MAG: hypothetical protein ACXVRS_14755 [Gaiellaceae bacterium]
MIVLVHNTLEHALVVTRQDDEVRRVCARRVVVVRTQRHELRAGEAPTLADDYALVEVPFAPERPD